MSNKIYIKRLKRVYVWEVPVRIFHWINAYAILILIITGFLITYPLPIMSSRDATHTYLMGWVRYIHFATAYVFVFNFIFRIYWGFVGNKYAQWHQFIPVTKKRIQAIWKVIRADILMIDNHEHQSMGHNALAGFIYFMMFIAFVIQVITGFALYSNNATWFFPKLFSWVSPMMGGDFEVRMIHHWTMWIFILFTFVHIYLVFYHDYVEGTGEISSMGGGYKFIYDEEDEKLAEKENTQVEEVELGRKITNKN